MIRVKHQTPLGQLNGNLASDILKIVSGVTGMVGEAVDGESQTGPTQEQIAAQQAAIAAAKAKEEESKRTMMYLGVGIGVLVIGGGLIWWSKNR